MTQKIMLFINGMVCQNCEKKIVQAVTVLNGVHRVTASFKKGTVEVELDIDVIDERTIIAVIEKLGYLVRKSQGSIAPLVIFLFAAYYIIQNTIGFQFIPEVSDNMGYGLLFVVGLLTSVHCIAMCGGIAVSQSIKTVENSHVKLSLLYNIGRVFSYTMVGGIVGSLGSIISPSGQFKGVVAIGAGIFMLLFGLKMLNVFTFPQWIKVKVPSFLFPKIKEGTPLRPLYVGLANGFMPCGPLQTIQLYALGTGSAINGAISMFVFSLGTVPLMLGFGIVTSLISGRASGRILKISATLVVVLGVIMMNRGLALSGFTLDSILPKVVNNEPSQTAVIEDGKQIVNMSISSRGYIPDVQILQAGIPVRINLNVSSLNGCNNPIVIPQYGIEKDLSDGENYIEFTPTNEGTITFSCWMGMITTRFNVVSDITKPDVIKEKENVGEGIFSTGNRRGVVQGENKVAIANKNGETQSIVMNVGNKGYSPNVLIVEKGIPVNWIIEGENLNICNYQLAVPGADFMMNLNKGINEIKFTPEIVEEIYFTCGMRMLYGKIVIVGDLEKINIDEIEKYNF